MKVHRAIPAVAAASIAAFATVAAASPTRDALIRPGRGIGRVDLGMTLAQVRQALGQPQYVQRTIERPFGARYVELAWNYGAWVVGLEGRSGALRVVRVSTSLSRERTRSGVGAGSPVRAVVKSFPGASCIERWRLDPYPGRWIVVSKDGKPATAFEVISFGGTYEASKPDRVVAVLVQQQWLSRSSSDSECADGWQSR